MLGSIVALLLGLGIVASAVVAWSSDSFFEWNWRTASSWPFRRRTRTEARSGIRAAAALWGLAGGLLIVAAIASLIWT